MSDAVLRRILGFSRFFTAVFASPLLALHALPEHGGQCSHLHHLLSPVQGDATGQAAQQGGGYPDPALDLHQVLPGEALEAPPTTSSPRLHVSV